MKPAKIHIRSICTPADKMAYMYEMAVILHTGERIRVVGDGYDSDREVVFAYVQDIELSDVKEEFYKKFEFSDEERTSKEAYMVIKFAIAGAITDFCKDIKDEEDNRLKERIYFKDYTPEKELEVNGGKSLRIPLDGTEVYPDEYETPDEYCARFDTWDEMSEDLHRKIEELKQDIQEIKKRIREKKKAEEAAKEQVKLEELNKENGAGTTCKSEEAKNPTEAKKFAEL